MDENQHKETNIKSTIDAVTGLAKAVPIYNDAIQPAAKEVGQALGVVAKTVNIALAPVKILIWGYDQIEKFVNENVAEKLKNTPSDNIKTPPIEVVGPALESLRFTGHKEELRNLFANLIANSIDSSTTENTHPGFVEIIKNMSSDEAKIMKLFTIKDTFPLVDLEYHDNDNSINYKTLFKNHSEISSLINSNKITLIPSFLDNLCRLGLLEIPSGLHLANDSLYKPLENSLEINPFKERFEDLEKRKIKFGKKFITLTSYGKQFCNTCVKDKQAS